MLRESNCVKDPIQCMHILSVLTLKDTRNILRIKMALSEKAKKQTERVDFQPTHKYILIRFQCYGCRFNTKSGMQNANKTINIANALCTEQYMHIALCSPFRKCIHRCTRRDDLNCAGRSYLRFSWSENECDLVLPKLSAHTFSKLRQLGPVIFPTPPVLCQPKIVYICSVYIHTHSLRRINKQKLWCVLQQFFSLFPPRKLLFCCRTGF